MEDTGLRFGAFLVPFHSLSVSPTAALHSDLDLTVELDRLGYEEVWYGEHHSGGMEIIGSPETFAAVAAERTRHVRVGCAVVSIPYHHPLMIADRIVMLDHLTRGRLMFGVGPGALTSDAAMMGIDPARQRAMMAESLEAIMALFRGESVTMETEWFKLREARLQLPSYSRPHVEMTVAAGASPAGSLAAGRHGLGVLNIGGVSEQALELNNGHWRLYEETCRENGHTPDRRNWRISSLIHVAETREQALENVQHGLDEWVQYFREVTSFAIVPRDITDAIEYLLGERLAAIGTPDDAIAHIERIWEATGGFGVHLELAHGWANWENTLRSHDLMRRYVFPHFRDAFRSRRQSWDWCNAHVNEFVEARNVAVQAEMDRHEETKKAKATVARQAKRA